MSCEYSINQFLANKQCSLKIAEGCGFQLSVDTGKELAKSLDEITAKCGGAEASEENRMVSRMIRTMATR